MIGDIVIDVLVIGVFIVASIVCPLLLVWTIPLTLFKISSIMDSLNKTPSP